MRYFAILFLASLSLATSAQEKAIGDSATDSGPTNHDPDAIPAAYRESPELMLEYLKGHRRGTLSAVADSESIGMGGIASSIGCFFSEDEKEKAYAAGYQAARSEVLRATNSVYFRTARQLLKKFSEIAEKDAEMQDLKLKAESANTR